MNTTELIKRYENGEGIESLAKYFSVGKLKIKKVLNDNNITIRGKGGVKKYNIPDNLPDLVINANNGFKIQAVCKKTKKIFNDYQNKSGALSTHLKTLDIKIPSYYESKKYYGQHNEHWFVKYFDFVEVPIQETIKCELCDWETTDIDNKSGAMIKHLKSEHNIIVSTVPEDLKKEDYVECMECGEKLKMINNTHLKKHNLKLSEYKLKYPNAETACKNTKDKLRELAKDNQELFKNTFKSKAEVDIYDWVKSIFEDAENGNRSLLKGTELDIVIPSINIAIEYNGLKYHTEWFGGKDKWYHLDKQKRCQEVGYNLIHIYEDEWETNSDIVKSKLSHLFGVSGTISIGARQCIIKEIKKNTAKDFIIKNHIQGFGKTSVRLGAYYGEVLVGVMTFTKRRGLEYELSRFCTHLDYSVYGLGSKMLKYFQNNYQYDSIISFADRAWTMDPLDNLYTKIGFKYCGYTNPDYKYYNSSVNRLKRFHKFGFRKSLLVSKYDNLNMNMTETEMVKAIGFDRIWNCGMYIYKL